MADTKPKNSSIPAWQQPGNATTNSTSTPAQNSDSRTTLLEQATKFLQDDSIRDASTDRKITFLESKGLRSDEIDGLLGISRAAETDSTSTNSTTEEASPDDSSSGLKASQESTLAPSSENTPQTSSDSSSSISSPASSSASSSTPAAAQRSPPRDVPPIITYPEFLVKESKPPPLVTLQSILYTLYGAVGLGASIYGASEFLVKPMIADLTEARHDFAETASDNLKKLNEKLEQNVSVIPPHLATPAAANGSTSEEDADSVTSDPTELFHRDMATQTSEDIVPTSSNTSDNTTTPDPTATVNSHLKRLQTISSHLREFNDTENESGSLDDTVRTRLNDLHHYCDSLIYSKPGYGPIGTYGAFSSPGMDTGRGAATGVGKGEEDAITSFKAEIRGVKGALLSARNFPSGRGGRVGGYSYRR